MANGFRSWAQLRIKRESRCRHRIQRCVVVARLRSPTRQRVGVPSDLVQKEFRTAPMTQAEVPYVWRTRNKLEENSRLRAGKIVDAGERPIEWENAAEPKVASTGLSHAHALTTVRSEAERKSARDRSNHTRQVASLLSTERKRREPLARAFEASTSRSRGGALVTRESSSSCAACAT